MPENTVEILVKIRDEATQALAAVQRQGEQAATGLARANQELGNIAAQSAQQVAGLSKTWKEFVSERMGPLMKDLGSHGAAMKQIGAEWQAYKGSVDAASGSSLGMARAAGAANEQLALTEGTTRGLTRSVRLATIEMAQGINPTLGVMVSGLDRAALAAQLTGGRLAGFAAAATLVGTGLALLIGHINEAIERQRLYREALASTDVEKKSGEIQKLVQAYKAVAETARQAAQNPTGMLLFTTEGVDEFSQAAEKLHKQMLPLAKDTREWIAAARENDALLNFYAATTEQVNRADQATLELKGRMIELANASSAAIREQLNLRAEILRQQTAPMAPFNVEGIRQAAVKEKRALDLQAEEIEAMKRRPGVGPDEAAALDQLAKSIPLRKSLLDLQVQAAVQAAAATNVHRDEIDSWNVELIIAQGMKDSEEALLKVENDRLATIKQINEAFDAAEIETAKRFDPEKLLAEGLAASQDPETIRRIEQRFSSVEAMRIATAGISADHVTAITREQQATVRLMEIENELAQIRAAAAGTQRTAAEEALTAHQRATAELQRQQVLWSEMVRTDPMVGLRVGLDESIEHLTSWGDTARFIVHDTADAMGRSFESLFTGRIKEGLKGLSDSIIRSLARIPAEMATSAIMQGIRNMLGGTGSPLAGSPSGGSLLSLANVFGGGPATGTGTGQGTGVLGFANPFGGGGSPSSGLAGFQHWFNFGGQGAESPAASVPAGAESALGSNAFPLGSAFGLVGGALGIYAGYQQAAGGNAMGIFTSTLSGAAAGSMFGPWGALIGGVIGLGVGLVGFFGGSEKARTPAFAARNNAAAQRIVDMLPEMPDEILDQLRAHLETGATMDFDWSWKLFNWPPGRWADFRPGGDVDRRIGPGLRQSLIEQVQAEQANRQQLERQTGFLFQEALAPGLTRYEALAGTGSRQRAQAVQAVRRGAFVELVNAAGDADIEQLITRIRSTAELRAIPILPRRRFMEVLG